MRKVLVLLLVLLPSCQTLDGALGEDYARTTELGELVLNLPAASAGTQLRAAFLVDQSRGCGSPGALSVTWFGPGGRPTTSCPGQDNIDSVTYKCDPAEIGTVTEARVRIPPNTCPLIFPAPPDLSVSWCGSGGCAPWAAGLSGWSCYNRDRPVSCGGVGLFVALIGATLVEADDL